jgi:hypothetical protein
MLYILVGVACCWAILLCFGVVLCRATKQADRNLAGLSLHERRVRNLAIALERRIRVPYGQTRRP